jgi:hypothetical protein
MSDEYGRDRIVDVSAKKTESEWSIEIQKFFERFTPLWFNWLGWVFAIGALAYFAESSDSLALNLLVKVSYSLIFLYAVFFVGSLKIEPYYSWANGLKGWRKVLAFIPPLFIASAIVFGLQKLIYHLVMQVQINS